MARKILNGKIVAGVLVVGVLVTVAVWPRAMAVDTARAARGPLVVTVDEDGTTRVRDRFVVTSPVGGEVLRLSLAPGDPVRKGAALATVRPAPPVPLDARSRAEAEGTVLSAEAVLGRLRADRSRLATALDHVAQQVRRTRTLQAGGAVAKEELEARETEQRSAEDALRAADFAIAQAEHDRDVARVRLSPAPTTVGRPDVTITAPIDGVVLKRFHESQAIIPPGEPIVELGDPTRLEIVADVLSADAVRLQPGSEVIIEQWGGATPLSGRVRRIEPSAFTKISALGVEEQRVNVIIDFSMAEDEPVRLGDNFRVDVRIVTWRSDSVLKVPAGSLFRRGSEWAGYVIEDGVARLRTVTVGRRSDRELEVTGGLAEGAVLVLFPPDTLQDGARVTVKEPTGRGR